MDMKKSFKNNLEKYVLASVILSLLLNINVLAQLNDSNGVSTPLADNSVGAKLVNSSAISTEIDSTKIDSSAIVLQTNNLTVGKSDSVASTANPPENSLTISTQSDFTDNSLSEKEKKSQVYKNAKVVSRYSAKLKEKHAKQDSLIPKMDGDNEMYALLRSKPNLWSIKRVEQQGELATYLDVDLVYIDGTREDQTCEISDWKFDPESTNNMEWKLKIGVDFVGGGSTVVADHIALCLQMVRDSLGYAIKKDSVVVYVPPKDVLEELEDSRINAEMDHNMQVKMLDVQKEVEFSGKCPSDINSYLLLMDIYEDVSKTPIDMVQISNELNSERNGGKKIFSCAFSRRWNEKYTEVANMECNVDENTCAYDQSNDGLTNWSFIANKNYFKYQPKKFLFIKYGGKSIHDGGRMLDLRLIPLSKNVYLEAYLDVVGKPITLGLITIGKQESIAE